VAKDRFAARMDFSEITVNHGALLLMETIAPPAGMGRGRVLEDVCFQWEDESAGL
jgi:hypothetical protein